MKPDPTPNDRTWFDEHPNRRARVRPATPTEAAGLSLAGDGLHVLLLYRLPDNRIVQTTGYVTGTPPDDEATAIRLVVAGYEMATGERV